MARTSQSLAGLVEAACERAANWLRAHEGRDLAESWRVRERRKARTALQDWGTELTRLCCMGEYRVASKVAGGGAGLPVDARIWWTPSSLLTSLRVVRDKPPMQELTTVALFAERIDYFLAALEREGTTRQLARDCRDDLDLLLVLADWCQDAGLPRAATEARHLHGLVRSYRFFP